MDIGQCAAVAYSVRAPNLRVTKPSCTHYQRNSNDLLGAYPIEIFLAEQDLHSCCCSILILEQNIQHDEFAYIMDLFSVRP